MGHNRNLADYAHHFDGTHIDLGSGNIETQGVVTFEDVSNVDSVGIITARDKIKLTSADGQIEATGATGLSINASGASAYVRLYSANTERLRINANGVFDFKDNSFTNVGSIALDFIKGDADDDTNITFAGNDTITFKAGSTSPALTVNTTQVKVEDNQKFVAGTGNDLQIYHDGSHSYIDDAGTGNLHLRSGTLSIQNLAGSKTSAVFNSGGGQELYHNNSKKFETTTTGATVTGTLVSELDLSAISSSISDTAVDIFVYDTRKDSDGGAWRKRTQHTSWYNETLNTSTRGSRKEFPAVAVIVAEVEKLTIYDGDDPDLPMWMVFLSPSTTPYSLIPNVSGDITSITALNGKITLGYHTNYGIGIWDFISEFCINTWRENSRMQYPGTIAERNDQKGSLQLGAPYILDYRGNDVAMTVLPNALIDDATGLPIPTIFVGTEAGLNILKEDGTVLDGTSVSGSNYERVQQITITDENYLWWTADLVFNSSYRRDSYALSLDGLPSGDFTWNNSTDTVSVGPSYSVSTGGEAGKIQIGNSNTWAFNYLARNALGGGAGFAIHKPNIGSENNSLFALITSDYNSGYMHGDCKGAFLADTDTTQKTNGQTDPDRSEYNYALTVNNTINKTAVATGAELVAYSNWSNGNGGNWMRHTNGINYGNAATITMGGWSKVPGSAVDGNYNYLCSCRSGSIPIGLAIHIDNGGSNAGKPYFYDITNSSLQSTGPRVDDDEWHHILGVLDGTSKKIYIDGELITSSTVTGVNLSAVDITNIGHYIDASTTTPQYRHGGYLALIKFLASAPTAEQVKKMYEEEKVLFQENAKCTLYGSSNAVTGLAYDDSTELYHVGTSAGRSDFQGLRRINNTTTAVTTAISASDELIAEQ